MIDQVQRAVGAQLREQGELGVTGAALQQRAARVVTDPANDRGTDARRADHRMRLPAQGLQQLLQRMQRRARLTYNLPPTAQDMQLVEAESVDDDHITVVLSAWRGAFGQARVRRLHDDDLAG